jgi:hypothetical protein
MIALLAQACAPMVRRTALLVLGHGQRLERTPVGAA